MAGTDKTPERIPYEIRNANFVIEQIQQLYAADPVGALKEYVTNGIDAVVEARLNGAKRNIARVGIVVNKEEGIITVQDNGIGMSYDFLRVRPCSIGESGRRGILEMRGEKAFGMLAYCGFGERANVVTRTAQDNGSYSFLRMERGKLEAEASRLEEKVVEKQMGPGFKVGTRVTIFGVNRQTIENYFTPARLKYAMAEMYDPILRSKEAEIHIGWHGKDQRLELVKPLHRTGQIVLSDPAETSEKVVKLNDGSYGVGELEIQLWINPDGTSEKVGFYNKGVKVLDSVAKLNEFDSSPWNRGKLSGYINANFCKLVPSRDGLVRDKSFEALGKLLKVYEPKLTELVRQAEQEATKKNANTILEQIREKIGDVYTNCPNPFTRGTGTPRGEPVNLPGKHGGSKKKNCPYPIDMIEFAAKDINLRLKIDDCGIYENSSHRDFRKFAAGRKDRQALLYHIDVLAEGFAMADFIAGRKSLAKAQNQEYKSSSINEESQQAIMERAMGLRLKLLEGFGIIKRRDGEEDEGEDNGGDLNGQGAKIS